MPPINPRQMPAKGRMSNLTSKALIIISATRISVEPKCEISRHLVELREGN